MPPRGSPCSHPAPGSARAAGAAPPRLGAEDERSRAGAGIPPPPARPPSLAYRLGVAEPGVRGCRAILGLAPSILHREEKAQQKKKFLHNRERGRGSLVHACVCLTGRLILQSEWGQGEGRSPELQELQLPQSIAGEGAQRRGASYARDSEPE